MKFRNLYLLLITLLITVFVFNLPILKNFRDEIKYKVKVDIINKNFKNKDLVIFEYSDLKEAKWVEEHEFILNNEMFDVIKKEEINGKIYYHCFNDTNENKIRKIQEFIAENLSFKPYKIPEFGIPEMVFHVSPNHFFEDIKTEKIEFEAITIILPEFPLLKDRFVDFYFHKLKIPPENCCYFFT